MTNPTCCGQPAKWVHINHRMEYWFCEKCKNEVQEKKAPETSDDDNNSWYPGLAGYIPPGAGHYKYTTGVGIFGGGGGSSSQAAQPSPPPPTPLGSGEIAQFTNGIDAPCYNNHIHCWMGRTSYNMGIACTCGQRVKAPTSAPHLQPQGTSTWPWPSVAVAKLLSATKALAGMSAGSCKKLVYNAYAVQRLTLEGSFKNALLSQGLSGLFSVEVELAPTTDEYIVTITKNY